MSTAKHTPGPWIGIDPKTKKFRSFKGWSVDKECSSHMSAPISAKGGPVCIVMTDDWYKKEEMHANARLISAAPDLLEACRKALYALKGREHDQFIRDAISKATGEQS